MINEEFMGAAKVHVEILIYGQLRWSHRPQAQHLVPAVGTHVSPTCTLVAASPCP